MPNRQNKRSSIVVGVQQFVVVLVARLQSIMRGVERKGGGLDERGRVEVKYQREIPLP